MPCDVQYILGMSELCCLITVLDVGGSEAEACFDNWARKPLISAVSELILSS